MTLAPAWRRKLLGAPGTAMLVEDAIAAALIVLAATGETSAGTATDGGLQLP